MEYISPDLSNIFIQIYSKYLEYIRSQDGVLGEIKTYRKIHSGGTRYTHADNEHLSTLNKISSEAIIKYDDALEYNIQQVSEKLYEMSNSHILQLQAMTFEKVKDITELTGNVFDAKGKEFDFDLLNEQLNSIEILFDKKGEPILPTLYCSKDLFEKIKNIKPTQEQLEKQKRIIEKKREIYLARKLNRNLSIID